MKRDVSLNIAEYAKLRTEAFAAVSHALVLHHILKGGASVCILSDEHGLERPPSQFDGDVLWLGLASPTIPRELSFSLIDHGYARSVDVDPRSIGLHTQSWPHAQCPD